MTNEELTMRIKAGETKLMDELWSQVNRFVYKQAYKFIRTYADRCRQLGLELEDLEQEGFLAIYEAVEGFDPERETTFLTYAGYHIKHRFFSVTKMNYTNWQNNAVRQASSLDEQAYTDNAELAVVDTLASDEDVEASVVDKVYVEGFRRDLAGAVAELNESWREVLHAIYVQELRPAEVARMKGVTRAVVGRKHRRALETLRANEAIQAYAIA